MRLTIDATHHSQTHAAACLWGWVTQCLPLDCVSPEPRAVRPAPLLTPCGALRLPGHSCEVDTDVSALAQRCDDAPFRALCSCRRRSQQIPAAPPIVSGLGSLSSSRAGGLCAVAVAAGRCGCSCCRLAPPALSRGCSTQAQRTSRKVQPEHYARNTPLVHETSWHCNTNTSDKMGGCMFGIYSTIFLRFNGCKFVSAWVTNCNCN